MIQIAISNLASILLYRKIPSGSYNAEQLLEAIDSVGLQYRKGKSIIDVIDARRKALKNGLQKSEVELDFFQLYLTSILKLKK